MTKGAPRVRHALSAFFAAGLLAAAVPSVGHAQDGLRIGPAGASTADADTREFVRVWEANPVKGYATLSPRNLTATKAAIARYKGIVTRGGWRTLLADKIGPDSKGPMVDLLRERLRLSGDLQDGSFFGDGEGYSYAVEKAVRRYQASNGLPPTGIADKATIAALNVPAAVRLKQLELNLGRLTDLSKSAARRYVMVNIPAAQIEAVENGVIVSRHAGVVGKVERPTPLLRSAITEMDFNPVWRLPPTVITQDLIPKGREMQSMGKSVLVKFGIDAYDGSGRKLDPERINWSSGAVAGYAFSQKPGKDNPLGFLKINFANTHSVYMHDTPKDSVFGRNFRAASSGCVRVQGIEQLATWLLAPNGWQLDNVEGMKESGQSKNVRLRRPVPLYFVYVTAWATEDGIVQFRRDVYNKDGLGTAVSSY